MTDNAHDTCFTTGDAMSTLGNIIIAIVAIVAALHI
jgi:hypothetical protein